MLAHSSFHLPCSKIWNLAPEKRQLWHFQNGMPHASKEKCVGNNWGIFLGKWHFPWLRLGHATPGHGMVSWAPAMKMLFLLMMIQTDWDIFGRVSRLAGHGTPRHGMECWGWNGPQSGKGQVLVGGRADRCKLEICLNPGPTIIPGIAKIIVIQPWANNYT